MITRICPIGVIILQMISAGVFAYRNSWRMGLVYFFVGMANVMILTLKESG